MTAESANTDTTSGQHVAGLLQASPEDTPTKLDLTQGSTTVSLYDEYGPMVINSDGTLSRIGNWKEMTPAERERTLKVLGKRNAIRHANLKEKFAETTAPTS